MKGRVAAFVGAALVGAGVLVLRSAGVWRSSPERLTYEPPPPGLLDGLVVLGTTRLSGGALLVAGLIVLAAFVGRHLARRGRVGRHGAFAAGLLGGVVVLGGVAGLFLVPRRQDIVYTGTYQLLGSAPTAPASVSSTVLWLPWQAWAAGVACLGLVILGLGVGLVQRKR